jgi:hypothetical protein
MRLCISIPSWLRHGKSYSTVIVFWTWPGPGPVDNPGDESDGCENKQDQTKSKKDGIPAGASVSIEGCD